MRIISGGQTGVDQAALYAARYVGLSTGGWMPKGFKTQEGNRPEFEHTFGMNESTSEGYASRTKTNIFNSDGTLQIAEKWDSPGEKLTTKWIDKYEKPSRKVGRTYLNFSVAIDNVYKWILENDIYVLNVAGNAERTAPGIFGDAYAYLIMLFEAIRDTEREPKQLKLFL